MSGPSATHTASCDAALKCRVKQARPVSASCSLSCVSVFSKSATRSRFLCDHRRRCIVHKFLVAELAVGLGELRSNLVQSACRAVRARRRRQSGPSSAPAVACHPAARWPQPVARHRPPSTETVSTRPTRCSNGACVAARCWSDALACCKTTGKALPGEISISPRICRIPRTNCLTHSISATASSSAESSEPQGRGAA